MLRYHFNNEKLLKQAVTHHSANQTFNYEKLELLGDAVLECIVACNMLNLMEKWKVGGVGSRILEATDSHSCKVKLVTNDTLARYAVFLGLHDLL